MWDAYERVQLVRSEQLDGGNREGPMSLTIAPDGRVFVISWGRDVMVYDPETEQFTRALERDFWAGTEDGGLGIAVDPDFENNQYIYLYFGYIPLPDSPQQCRFPSRL